MLLALCSLAGCKSDKTEAQRTPEEASAYNRKISAQGFAQVLNKDAMYRGVKLSVTGVQNTTLVVDMPGCNAEQLKVIRLLGAEKLSFDGFRRLACASTGVEIPMNDREK